MQWWRRKTRYCATQFEATGAKLKRTIIARPRAAFTRHNSFNGVAIVAPTLLGTLTGTAFGRSKRRKCGGGFGYVDGKTYHCLDMVVWR